MQDLTLTLIQSDLAWEAAAANLGRFDAEIDRLEQATDLIILPEMFSTGFSMDAPQLAESMDGTAIAWMRQKAVEEKTAITGSVMVRDQNLFYNRLIFARADGSIETYDKKHLFRYAGEEKIFTAGNQRLTLNLKGWKIRPFICYDSRFPIWTRNLNCEYDLAIFIANWPVKRAHHWRSLLVARAIENQAYVAAVNRVGTDGNGFEYSGNSAVIDPAGKVLFEKEQTRCTTTINLSREALITYRRDFPAWMDADTDLVTRTD